MMAGSHKMGSCMPLSTNSCIKEYWHCHKQDGYQHVCPRWGCVSLQSANTTSVDNCTTVASKRSSSWSITRTCHHCDFVSDALYTQIVLLLVLHTQLMLQLTYPAATAPSWKVTVEKVQAKQQKRRVMERWDSFFSDNQAQNVPSIIEDRK